MMCTLNESVTSLAAHKASHWLPVSEFELVAGVDRLASGMAVLSTGAGTVSLKLSGVEVQAFYDAKTDGYVTHQGLGGGRLADVYARYCRIRGIPAIRLMQIGRKADGTPRHHQIEIDFDSARIQPTLTEQAEVECILNRREVQLSVSRSLFTSGRLDMAAALEAARKLAAMFQTPDRRWLV